MSGEWTDDAVRDWARQHKACWELLPLREMVKGEGVRETGLELHLFAEYLPPPEQEHGWAGAQQIHERLHAIAERVIPHRHEGTRFDIEPFDAAGHLRPETGFAPEIQLSVLVTAENTAHEPEEALVRGLMREIERALAGLGLKARSWEGSPSR